MVSLNMLAIFVAPLIDTYQLLLANKRTHVQRAGGRMQVFRILAGTIPIPLVTLLDDIVLVCAALCNLQRPLISN